MKHIRQTDEEVVPEAELLALAKDVLGKHFGRLEIRPRKGRSERVTIWFADKARVSLTHARRTPGETRRAAVKFLNDIDKAELAAKPVNAP